MMHGPINIRNVTVLCKTVYEMYSVINETPCVMCYKIIVYPRWQGRQMDPFVKSMPRAGSDDGRAKSRRASDI